MKIGAVPWLHRYLSAHIQNIFPMQAIRTNAIERLPTRVPAVPIYVRISWQLFVVWGTTPPSGIWHHARRDSINHPGIASSRRHTAHLSPRLMASVSKFTLPSSTAPSVDIFTTKNTLNTPGSFNAGWGIRVGTRCTQVVLDSKCPLLQQGLISDLNHCSQLLCSFIHSSNQKDAIDVGEVLHPFGTSCTHFRFSDPVSRQLEAINASSHPNHLWNLGLLDGLTLQIPILHINTFNDGTSKSQHILMLIFIYSQSPPNLVPTIPNMNNISLN